MSWGFERRRFSTRGLSESAYGSEKKRLWPYDKHVRRLLKIIPDMPYTELVHIQEQIRAEQPVYHSANGRRSSPLYQGARLLGTVEYCSSARSVIKISGVPVWLSQPQGDIGDLMNQRIEVSIYGYDGNLLIGRLERR